MESIVETLVQTASAYGVTDRQLSQAVAYTSLLLMATLPIYFGSFKSAAPKSEQQKQDGEANQAMTTKDAYMFPVIGSCVLFGLYMLYKFIPKEYLNILFGVYFMVIGVSALTETLKPFFLGFIPRSIRSRQFVNICFKIPFTSENFKLQLDGADMLVGLISLAVAYYYLTTKHWMLNNVFGLSFSLVSISLISLGSVKVGCILLCGLFIYDIFWVFGTDVMVTVAKSFDAPIKLLFPRDIFVASLEKPGFQMLGLGDIVVPGIFVSLMMRFDEMRSKLTKKRSLLYFNTCLTFYVIGLVSTIVVMHTFQAAQPALLYLVPCCLGSVLILAAVRGELTLLFSYSEEEKTEEEKQKEAKKTAVPEVEKKVESASSSAPAAVESKDEQSADSSSESVAPASRPKRTTKKKAE